MTAKKIATHSSHATHSTAAHETASATEEATTPTPATEESTPLSPSAIATILAGAQSALALISKAQVALPLTPGLGEKARKSALGLQMIPTELLTEAASFLAENGSRFPSFDAATVQTAAQLEAALNQVVAKATTLIQLAQSTVLEARGPAVEDALALYAVLKAQSRRDSSVRATVERMAPLVSTRKTPHQTKEQREKAKAKKLAELSASAPAPAAAAPSVTPETAAPAAPSATSQSAGAPPATQA